MGRAGLGRAAETSWAVFVLVVFLFSWFSRQTTWEIVGPEPDPPPYETGGVTVEAGVPEPGCLKESCSSVMQKLLPHFTEEETEAQSGEGAYQRANTWWLWGLNMVCLTPKFVLLLKKKNLFYSKANSKVWASLQISLIF